MALANAAVIGHSPYGVARISYYCEPKAPPFLGSHGLCGSSFCVGSHAGNSDVVLERRKLKPSDNTTTRIVEKNTQMMKSTVEIPVSCYQVIQFAVFVLLLL